MSVPTNTYDAFTMIGIREDLSDMIWDVSPLDTPFITACKKTTATNTLHEWQTDALASASTSNAQIEGDDATADAATATVRLKNSTQILRKVPQVSGTGQKVTTAGRDDEMDYQVAKRMKEIKRDLEAIVTGVQGRAAGASGTTARKLRALGSWYATNTNGGTSYAVGTDTTAPTDGTQRAFVESNLQTVLKSIYTNGGDPDVIMVGPKQKQVFSSFTGGATKQINTEKKSLITSVDFYESDYGELKVVPNRFQRDRDCHILQTDMWALAWLRPFAKEPLAKTGDSDRVQIIGEVTLESRNEKASGIVADLS